MNTKYWLIIKDEAKKTFEVCGQVTNDNSFANETYAMRKAGMLVSGVTPPVTAKTSSKELIKFVGYEKEEGLYARLQKQYRDLSMQGYEDWEE
ncbi:MAG: hypothetical protein DI538_13235 [Azospira oryzae]|jgi:hypothetical protein|nr:hypothetical protein [Cytophaga sp.]PZR36913.1 MAG: hypothetical protein DI538_13235 [Azospira oryzae]